MSKIDDLRTINNCAYHKFLNDIEGRETEYPDAIVEAERAGIAAVVRALRDEIDAIWTTEDMGCGTILYVFNEILGSDAGEKVGEMEGSHYTFCSHPTTDPAPVNVAKMQRALLRKWRKAKEAQR